MYFNLLILLFYLGFGYLLSNIFQSNKNENKVRLIFIHLASFILILQSGLRNIAVGDDTYNYLKNFEDVKFYSWNYIFDLLSTYTKYGEGKDPGYVLFQKIFQIFSLNYQLFLIFIALLFFYSFGFFIYKNTIRLRDVVIAYIIYTIMFYSFYSITGIRQTIVTAFVLLSLGLLKQKKKLPFFFILIYLASFIHKSVLIFMLFAIISLFKKTKLLIWSVLIAFPFLFVFSSRINVFLIKLSESYSEYEHHDEFKPTTLVIMLLLIAFVGALRHDQMIKANINSKIYFTAFAFAVFFLSLVFEIHGYLRLVQYFSFFMVLFIPEILNSFQSYSEKIKNDFTIFAMLLLIGLHIKTSLSNPEKYAFFWQEMRLEKHYFEND